MLRLFSGCGPGQFGPGPPIVSPLQIDGRNGEQRDAEDSDPGLRKFIKGTCIAIEPKHQIDQHDVPRIYLKRVPSEKAKE
jgi:hypothetical protein